MKHCMIDLETMGVEPGCAVISIGGCGFVAREGSILIKFKRNITLESCLEVGLHVNPSTEAWWAEQSEEARAALASPEPISLRDALGDFFEWYTEQQFDRIWSHGAAADVTWLEAAYRAVDEMPPWKYRDSRDTRTLFDLIPTMERTVPVVEHCALQDASAQAQDVHFCLTRLSISLGLEL